MRAIYESEGYSILLDSEEIEIQSGGQSKRLPLLEPMDLRKNPGYEKMGISPATHCEMAGYPIRLAAREALQSAWEKLSQSPREKLRAAHDAASAEAMDHADAQERAWDHGNDCIGCEPQEARKAYAVLAVQHPRDALYLSAERQANHSANDRKASAGKEAMQMIEEGASLEAARERMENWLPLEAAWA